MHLHTPGARDGNSYLLGPVCVKCKIASRGDRRPLSTARAAAGPPAPCQRTSSLARKTTCRGEKRVRASCPTQYSSSLKMPPTLANCGGLGDVDTCPQGSGRRPTNSLHVTPAQPSHGNSSQSPPASAQHVEMKGSLSLGHPGKYTFKCKTELTP